MRIEAGLFFIVILSYFSITKSYIMILRFQSSFRLSEKNEKDKKRKVSLF